MTNLSPKICKDCPNYLLTGLVHGICKKWNNIFDNRLISLFVVILFSEIIFPELSYSPARGIAIPRGP